jgi:hypothetical protein
MRIATRTMVTRWAFEAAAQGAQEAIGTVSMVGMRPCVSSTRLCLHDGFRETEFLIRA